MFTFAAPRPRRKPSLTPMIDVVFLLLVFFMLASRFGIDTRLVLNVAGATTAENRYSGPPRLIDIDVEGHRLNGVDLPLDRVIGELADLSETPEDTVILRASEGTHLQDIVDTIEALSQAGYINLVVVE